AEGPPPVPCGQSPRARAQPGAAPANHCSSVTATQPAVATPRYNGCLDMPPSMARSGLPPQSTVQVKCGADQSHVRERLREVAQRLARRSRLLGVQSQVVGVGKHLLENEARLLHPACARQRLDQPECTHIERPLAASQPVAGASTNLVAMH